MQRKVCFLAHYMIIYFPGCTIKEKLPHIMEKTIDLLDSMKIDYAIKDGCCGSFLYYTGFIDEFKKNAKNWLRDTDAELIITSCAGCFNILKNIYLSLNIPILHVTQYFADCFFKTGKLKIKINKLYLQYAVYHDPCHLSRKNGVYDAPRRLLKACNVDIKELKNNRESSNCCGAGGGVASLFPELADAIAMTKLKEVKEIGVDSYYEPYEIHRNL